MPLAFRRNEGCNLSPLLSAFVTKASSLLCGFSQAQASSAALPATDQVSPHVGDKPAWIQERRLGRRGPLLPFSPGDRDRRDRTFQIPAKDGTAALMSPVRLLL